MNREKNWHSLTVADVERILRTDGASGLFEKEAARRLRHGKNTVWEQKTVSAKRYALRSFLDLTTVLLVLTVLAAAFFSNAYCAVAICIMLLVGRAARVAIYILAERVFEKNASIALPRAKVVRGGTVKVVASDMIAPGDVIILDSGDTVPCDIRLTAADNILVSEGSVTGVEGIISKSSDIVPDGMNTDVPISMRKNIVYASSVIISGFAIGIAVGTGDDTLICAREGSIVLKGENDVATVEKLSDWGRVCSLCLIAMSLVVTVIGVAMGEGGLADYFLPSIAMAAACLSEYIAVVGAHGWAVKLKASGCGGGVLTKASVAQDAANADMMVLRSASVMRSGKTTLHSYYNEGKLTMMGTKDAKAPTDLLCLASYCTGAYPDGSVVQGGLGSRQRTAGILSYDLVRSLWDENKGGKVNVPKYTIVQHMPAGDTESGGLDSTLLALGNDFYFCVMGSVERILSLSSYKKKGGENVPLTEKDTEEILAFASELRKHGVTLAAVGFRSSHYNNLRRISVLQSSLCFEGFIAVADRPADGVVASLCDFREKGGKLVIFSERGEEDKFYLQAEGVFKTGDAYYTRKESASMNNISAEKGSLTVLTTPSGTEGIKERLRFVKLLRESAKTLTYIGYGVEDMWNMKSADVAFALPSSGGSIPQGVRCEAHGIADSAGGGLKEVCTVIGRCRKALSNIKNSLNYLIVSHVARLVLMLLCAAAGLPLVSAASLVLWGIIIDFAIAFAIVSSKGKDEDARFKAGKLTVAPDRAKEVIIPTMYGALTAVLSVVVPFASRQLLSYAGYAQSTDSRDLVTCMLLSCLFAMPFIGAEFASGYGIFSKRSRIGALYILPAVLTVVSAAGILFIPWMKTAFETTFPGWIMTAFSLAPAALMVVIMSVVRAVRKK